MESIDYKFPSQVTLYKNLQDMSCRFVVEGGEIFEGEEILFNEGGRTVFLNRGENNTDMMRERYSRKADWIETQDKKGFPTVVNGTPTRVLHYIRGRIPSSD